MSGRSNKPLHQRLRLTKKNLRLRDKVNRDNRRKFGSPRKGYITPGEQIFVPSAGWSPRTAIRNKVEKSMGVVGDKVRSVHWPTIKKIPADRHVAWPNFKKEERRRKREWVERKKYSGRKWPIAAATMGREELIAADQPPSIIPPERPLTVNTTETPTVIDIEPEMDREEEKENRYAMTRYDPDEEEEEEEAEREGCTNCSISGGRKTKRRRKKLRRKKLRRKKLRRTKRRRKTRRSTKRRVKKRPKRKSRKI